MNSRVLVRLAERGLVILGVVLLAVWLRSDLESRAFQSAESARLETALREPGSGATDLSGVAFAGPSDRVTLVAATQGAGVLGKLEIPRLHIGAIVAEGTDPRTLGHAVGHVPSTVLPGRPGNCALAGHRDTFLRGLGGVRVNDTIRLVTHENAYTYRVQWIRVVEPRSIEVLDSTASRSLTLITCYPFGYVGPAPRRFVVRAVQVDRFTSDLAATHGGMDHE